MSEEVSETKNRTARVVACIVIFFLLFLLSSITIALLVKTVFKQRTQLVGLEKSVQYYRNTPTPTRTRVVIDDFQSVLMPVYDLWVNYAQSELQSSVQTSGRMSVWWVSNDDLNIINDDATGVSWHHTCDAPGFTQEFKESLSQQVESIMQDNGYVKNAINSSTSIADETFYDYIQGYEKKDVKCVLEINPDCTGTEDMALNQEVSVVCTKHYDENYDRQAIFLRDLGITNGVIRIENIVDDYALLHVHQRRTGGLLIARKVNNVWTEIDSGNGIEPERVTELYNLPEELFYP